MTDRKTQAERLENRLLTEIERTDGRHHLWVRLPKADLRRMMRSLDARADGIMARRDRDPVLREMAAQEAANCRRLAAHIEATLAGARQ